MSAGPYRSRPEADAVAMAWRQLRAIRIAALSVLLALPGVAIGAEAVLESPDAVAAVLAPR